MPDIPLRAWQRDALDAWGKERQRGIVAAATGTGKTLLALNAIAAFAADGGRRVVVVVPKQVLQDQWVSLFRTTAGLGPDRLGTIGGRRPDFKLTHQVVVAVLDSARTRLTDPVAFWRSQGERVLLIVDECHWAGSERSETMFRLPYDATLGLSATPERGDDGFDDILVPNLGPVVYRYTVRAALDDRLLADLSAINVYFRLGVGDHSEYARLTERITELRAGIKVRYPDLGAGPGWDARLNALAADDPDAKRLANLVQQRRKLVATTTERLTVLQRVVDAGALDGRHVLIFNETVAQAEATLAIVEAAGARCDLEHSRLPPARRDAAYRRFASGAIDILVAVRALDEGVDVPDANGALIVSGTLNPRQRIQRIGRVLRPKGERAVVWSLLARDTEEFDVGRTDDELLGADRVTHVHDIKQWLDSLGMAKEQPL